jgi:hypothetical protein
MESKRNKNVIEGTNFTINNAPLKNGEEFKDLGQVLEKNHTDWPADQSSISQAQMVWGHLQKLLWCGIMGVDRNHGKSFAKIPLKLCKIYNWKTH